MGELVLLETKRLFARVATRRAHEEVLVGVVRVMRAQIVQRLEDELTHFALESRGRRGSPRRRRRHRRRRRRRRRRPADVVVV